MHKSFSKHLGSLSNINKFAKSNRFSTFFVSYFTVVSPNLFIVICDIFNRKHEKVQVGKVQEKAQSEKDSHSKNRGGKKPN